MLGVSTVLAIESTSLHVCKALDVAEDLQVQSNLLQLLDNLPVHVSIDVSDAALLKKLKVVCPSKQALRRSP